MADTAFILLPAILTSAMVILNPNIFKTSREVPPWAWFVLIVGIDVAHVYSSLYRTYFDRMEFQRRRTLYLTAPVCCWVIGSLLYTMSPLLFWSVLAYVAVFHFIRQQYGFMRIYSRHETESSPLFKHLDQITIYAAMLYPLLFWHNHLPRHFNWFLEGDFLEPRYTVPDSVLFTIYVTIFGLYTVKELALLLRFRKVNIPRNLLIAGTAASWYTGIVLFNGDLAFTTTNVVAHGVPYMALIWIYCHNKSEAFQKDDALLSSFSVRFYSIACVPLFLGLVMVFAFFEEGIWEILVWRDHPMIFGAWSAVPQITNHSTLSWLVPLLALPQSTHYILDGFIWRINKSGSELRKILLGE